MKNAFDIEHCIFLTTFNEMGIRGSAYKGTPTIEVFVDFKIAFDTINHSILLTTFIEMNSRFTIQII